MKQLRRNDSFKPHPTCSYNRLTSERVSNPADAFPVQETADCIPAALPKRGATALSDLRGTTRGAGNMQLVKRLRRKPWLFGPKCDVTTRHCRAAQVRETGRQILWVLARSPMIFLYRHTSWPGPVFSQRPFVWRNSFSISSCLITANNCDKNLQTEHSGSLLTLIRSGSSTTLAKWGRRLVTNMSSFFPLLGVLHFLFMLCCWGESWETACKPKRDVTRQKAEEGQYPK